MTNGKLAAIYKSQWKSREELQEAFSEGIEEYNEHILSGTQRICEFPNGFGWGMAFQTKRIAESQRCDGPRGVTGGLAWLESGRWEVCWEQSQKGS